LPKGREVAEYRPAASLWTVRENPVSWFRSTTCTPGSTASVLSFTVPEMVPVTAWLSAIEGVTRARKANSANSLALDLKLIIFHPFSTL
jgi:hypothetical protein